ncbi:MAG: fumarate reductase iron-sulfur subunit [Betaproteobacteria bacterium]|nr:fumarate reductase iron-sulfur subunit [Betaproteobacteria bacterium]
MSRSLRFHVFRHNPRDAASAPSMQTYTLEETPGMTLFIALTRIREEHDPGLNFDFVCRAGVCGSCAMVINGRPGLACRTLTTALPDDVTLLPLPGFELIGDLSVHTGKWMHGLAQRLQTWVHTAGETDLDRIEAAMDPDLADAIYELDRCIECGCCIAACGTAQTRPDFMGAAGMNKVARFRLDPRDVRDDADWYEVVGDDSGVFGCMTLLGCQDVCPKQLSLQTQLAWLRRAMARQGVRG